jgi:hypothetical protein
VSYILDSIAGPYPYLLVAQILIVSSLLLSLIWIFIQRAQQGELERAEQGALLEVAKVPTPAPFESPAPVVEKTAVPAATPERSASPDLATPAVALNKENEAEIQKLSAESEGLKDKVRYLESRLMEYEIVQEEISNLGALRSENEKLKEELMKLSAAPSGGPAAASSESVETVMSANEVLESVSKNQIDTILDKLDKITQKG